MFSDNKGIFLEIINRKHLEKFTDVEIKYHISK